MKKMENQKQENLFGRLFLSIRDSSFSAPALEGKTSIFRR
jgi:hypothetical protein